MFGLPDTTVVDQPLHKNAFDTQLKPQSRQMLSALVARMTWCNKLSVDTTALPACDLEEIEVLLLRQIKALDAKIAKTTQFNKKVELVRQRQVLIAKQTIPTTSD